jgi:4-nitrophenyl phosphatase
VLFDLYIFDLDGTLYRGDEPIAHAVETVAELARRGAEVRYLTNNSSKTRREFALKLGALGYPVRESDVVSTAIGAARLFPSNGWKSAYVIGEPGLVATLRGAGVDVVNADPDGRVAPDSRSHADAVLVGICRRFDYDLLDGAMQQILGGARFVASNPDATYPLEGGRLIPGSGSLVAAVQACTSETPLVIGKPEPFLVQMVLEEARVAPERALVVGDRIDTDLEAGARAGCPTHLVLTGVTREPPPRQAFSPDLRGLLHRPGPAGGAARPE